MIEGALDACDTLGRGEACFAREVALVAVA
jgi:hypothetical protein